MVAVDAERERPDVVDVAIFYSRKRSRLSVGFRLILLIPQVIVLYFLGIATLVVTVLSWFAALVLGRLPGWATSFLVGMLGWQARYGASVYLLDDAYPPFGFSADAGYPVRVSAVPGRLNRLAVLFRIVLSIPALIVSALVSIGAAVATLVAWVVIVVSGRMPRSLFQALFAALRYVQRVSAYSSFLVTATYPGGLFRELPTGGWGEERLFGEGSGGEVNTVGDAQVVELPTAAVGAWTPEPVALSSAAKTILCLFLGLGVVAMAGVGVGVALGFKVAVSSEASLLALQNAHDRFVPQVQAQTTAIEGCASSPTVLQCVTAGDRALAQSYNGYATDVATTSFPSFATAAAAVLSADLAREARVLDLLAQSPTIPAYEATASRDQLAQLDQRSRQDEQHLFDRLRAG